MKTEKIKKIDQEPRPSHPPGNRKKLPKPQKFPEDDLKAKRHIRVEDAAVLLDDDDEDDEES